MLQLKALEKAILKTIVYGDIFNFPLTFVEIYKYLIYSKSVDRQLLKQSLDTLIKNKHIAKRGHYFYLKGREEIMNQRQKKQKESEKKMELLKPIISYLSIIPTICFIGISGNLAMHSADEMDDIDLFIISSERKIWSTRFAVLCLLNVIGKNRRRNETHAKNKICVNMFMDEQMLSLPQNKQDLYSAHEVAQIIPVLDRNNTYQKFLSVNKWVIQFLPNSLTIEKMKNEEQKKKHFFNFLELFAEKIQYSYMKKHITRETISKSLLAFHPIDYRTKILREFSVRLKKYNIS